MKSKGLKTLPIFLAGTLAGALAYGFVIGSLVNIRSQKAGLQPQELKDQNWTCTELLNSSLNEIDIRGNDNQPVVEATKPLSQHTQELAILRQDDIFTINYLGDSFESQDLTEINDIVTFDFSREQTWEKTSFSTILNKKTGFMILSATSKIDDRETSRISGFQKSFSCK